ncbi:MAG: hypothetical protein HY330_02920, partial [Chloroflexi bacterium]|nr:hypothetical protein [Chloroflexota bacterium]
MKKLLVIVAAVMVLGVTAAALAGGWLLGRGGGTPPLAEAPRITTPRITGFVEYVVRDAQGNVKYRSARHNTKLTLLLSDTRD